MEIDLELLGSTAEAAEKRSDTARLLQLSTLADEVEAHMTSELDFEEEAGNAELIRTIIEPYEGLTVPPRARDPLAASPSSSPAA